MRILFCLILLNLSNFLYGQNTLVEYDVICNGQGAKTQIVFNDSLSFSNLVSNTASKSTLTITVPPIFIKKFKESAVYENEVCLNLTFYVKDSLHSMKWELTNDTNIILNEKCFSAKTYFRGRYYIAYYSTKYANSNGPWKLGGLPGLILAAKSDDNFIQWTAVKIIDNYVTQAEPLKINNYKFIAWDEYVAKFITTIDKWVRSVRSSGVIKNDVESKIKIDATEIIYPKLQTGEGITF